MSMSGGQFQPKQIVAALRSKRGMTWIVVATLAIGGGYYFLGESPSPKMLPKPRKPSAAAVTPNKSSATKREANTPTKQTAASAARPQAPRAARPVARASAPDSDIPDVEAQPATRPATMVKTPPRVPVINAMNGAAPAEPLGPVYSDDAHGFTMRFPTGWAIHTFTGDPWVLDCGDVKSGLISVGFSPCPAEITADKLLPEAIARRIKRRPNTTLHGQGRCTIAGRAALWSKSTGPLPMTNADPMMTRVQYIIPLGDGRVLEIRVAAPPEKFDAMTALMKKAMDSFQVTPRQEPGAQTTVASTPLNP